MTPPVTVTKREGLRRSAGPPSDVHACRTCGWDIAVARKPVCFSEKPSRETARRPAHLSMSSAHLPDETGRRVAPIKHADRFRGRSSVRGDQAWASGLTGPTSEQLLSCRPVWGALSPASAPTVGLFHVGQLHLLPLGLPSAQRAVRCLSGHRVLVSSPSTTPSKRSGVPRREEGPASPSPRVDPTG